MKTVIWEISPVEANLDSHPGLIEGGRILQGGGLVAFPTETVYGLGANGLDPEAVRQIYVAKGRPSDNPLILHIAELDDLEQLVTEVPEQAQKLMTQFWPGPLTLVFQKQPSVPREVTGGLDTVAVRMPSHPIARALIQLAGVPIAAPSANRSGRPSPTLAQHVVQDMDGRVAMIIDGGPCEVGVESTVVDVTTPEAILLRPGGISLEDLREVLGDVKLDVGVASAVNERSEEFKPRSPGMKYRHYSPEAEILIVEGERERVQEKMLGLLTEMDRKLALLATTEMVMSLNHRPFHRNSENGEERGIVLVDSQQKVICFVKCSEIAAGTGQIPTGLEEVQAHPTVFTIWKEVSYKILGERDDLQEMAARLFRLLREFDEEDVELILAEGLPLQGVGLAVMNRLRKAAGYQILQV